MPISYFAVFHNAAPLSDADRARVIELVRATPDLCKALVYTPAATRDPYLDDGPPPHWRCSCISPTSAGSRRRWRATAICKSSRRPARCRASRARA